MTQLVSRQADSFGGMQPARRQSRDDALMQRAKQIAQAPRDMLPKGYQNNPGACLLACDWAERNDVSILEALGEVAFVHGKPVVSAVMQKRLAARYGYKSLFIEGDKESSTVAVIGPDGDEVGRYTYTIEQAEELGITKGSKVWDADPEQMLYKRATTRALERFASGELSTILIEPDNSPSPDSPMGGLPGDGGADIRDPNKSPSPVAGSESGALTPDGPNGDGPVDDADTEPPLDYLGALEAAIEAAGITKAKVAKHWRKGVDQIALEPIIAEEVLVWIGEQI